MENNTIQYQLRTDTLTDREILLQLPELINEDSLNYEQYIALQEFRVLSHTLQEIDPENRDQVRRLNKEITDLVNTPILQDLLRRGRSIIFAQERERDQIIYENYLRRIRGTPPKPEALKQETVLKAVEMHDAAIKQKEKEQAVKAKQEARQRLLNKTKSIFASIPLSVLGLLEFYIVEIIAVLVIMLIHIIISYIPILNIIDEWFSRKAGSDIVEASLCFGAAFAYSALTETAERILKSAETRRFTLIFTGVLLVILNVVFLITNIINHEAVLANIIIIAAGIVLFIKNKDK